MYTLGYNTIGEIQLDDKIFHEELSEWKIIHRESFLEELFCWIAEAIRGDRSDATAMKDDLFMLSKWEDEYIFSSISTNDYVREEDSRFKDICKELLKLNNSSIDFLNDKYVEITMKFVVKYNANELDIQEVVDAATICFYSEDKHSVELFAPSTDDMEVIEYMEESFIDVTEQILKSQK